MRIIGGIKVLHRDEAGLEMVEYAVMAGIILACGTAVILAMGTQINVRFNQLVDILKSL
jgi:Flp pilus assembly pilin Flp